MKRIGFGGIATESCTFSPAVTALADFTLLRGAALAESGRYPFLSDMAGQFLPLLHARALPGAPVAAHTYQNIKTEFLTRLQAALPLDGVYLDLHGAMNVAGMDDAEGDWAVSVRQTVGPDCLISASMDLHGNISERFVAAIDMLTAYRTAPHIDVLETRAKACRMLMHCLAEGRRPQITRLPVPVLLPGERTSTEYEPAAAIYAALAASDMRPEILDASIFVGYVWADEPRASATVIVTGFDEVVCWQEARRLGQLYWDARHQFQFGVPAGTADECIQQALAAPEDGIFISDSGDNPTAGGAGDIPYMTERLLANGVPSAIVASIVDPGAVASCYAAGLGNMVNLSIGGKLDPLHGERLSISGQVIRLKDDDPVGRRIAVVQVDGVKVILTERRKPLQYISDFDQLDLDALAHKIVV
ncbi:MAG: M81 family metallopeptidase, partial [Anaerolineales bacterium]|nr:M81 family metallopeptidase [Anaerolineales bacterium]